MVIDRGAFLSGRYAKVVDEIVRVKEACGAAHLKVILETGELGTYDNVRRASLLAIAAGADFIKTSTGKVSPAATLPVTLCMLEVIRDVHDETGRIIGMKPAGGIRTAKQAIQYLCVLNETLGSAWMTPGALPLRRLVAPQRRADADPQAEDRRLPVRRLLHHRLMADLEKTRVARTGPARMGVRARARVARRRPLPGAVRPLRRRRAGRAALRRVVLDDRARDRGAPRRGRAGARGGRRPRRRRRRGTPSRTAGRSCRAPSGPSTSSASRASCSSARASSPSPSR